MKREETERLASLSRQELKELEAKEKTMFQIALDWIIMVLPIICGVIAILEYKMIPDKIMILSILVDTFISKISLPMQPVPEIGSISGA